MALTDKLSAIGDAIRAKTGKSGLITLDEMPIEIAGIQTGSADIPFKFGGINAEKVSEYYEKWTLADTSFEIGVSASTTATSILATTTNRYTNTTGSPTLAWGDDDCVVVQRGFVTPTHGSGATGKAQHINYAIVYVTHFSKRKTTDTSANTTRQAYSMSGYISKYYNTSGTVTRAVANYGFYMTPQVPTFASTTSANTYLRCSSPILYYRASSSYESTANIKFVTDCTFEWHVEVYKVSSRTTVTSAINDETDNLLLNGMSVPDTAMVSVMSLDDEEPEEPIEPED